MMKLLPDIASSELAVFHSVCFSLIKIHSHNAGQEILAKDFGQRCQVKAQRHGSERDFYVWTDSANDK